MYFQEFVDLSKCSMMESGQYDYFIHRNLLRRYMEPDQHPELGSWDQQS